MLVEPGSIRNDVRPFALFHLEVPGAATVNVLMRTVGEPPSDRDDAPARALPA
jgi:hypothetical protein